MLIDVYVLAPRRAHEVVRLFQRTFANGFEETSEEYSLPHLGDDPVEEFSSVDLLIDRLLEEKSFSSSVCWVNRSIEPEEPRCAMIFFTEDGGLIVGLSVGNGQELEALRELRKVMASELSLIAAEEPPPETAAEFIARATPRMPATE